MQQLIIEDKIIGFKTLTISNVLHRALVKYRSSSTITKLEKIRKQFIWKNGNPKLKHAALCNAVTSMNKEDQTMSQSPMFLV